MSNAQPIDPACVLESQCHLAHPPSQVVLAIADTELLSQWWGPDGFTSQFETFGLNPGDEWVFTMHAPDGKVFPNTMRVVENDAPRRLVIDHTTQPNFRLSILLDDQPDGCTLTWHMAFATPELRDNVAKYAADANQQLFARLKRVLDAMG